MPLSPRVRELVTTLAVLGGLLALVALYTQNWPPAVIVESSSMMHADHEVTYGRIGTIDPGDLVLVKSVDSPDDVTTFFEGGRDRYGSPGDVVVYFSGGLKDRTPIIHRAMAYVELDDSGGERRYRVRWDPDAPCLGNGQKPPGEPAWCVFPSSGIYLPEHGIASASQPYKPNRAGFITKGDNPVTNTIIDPVSGTAYDERGNPSVVAMEWVDGKARGEIPWIGLIKLALGAQPNERFPPESYVRVGNAWAPQELWVMLTISLVVLIGGPLAYDYAKARRDRERDL